MPIEVAVHEIDRETALGTVPETDLEIATAPSREIDQDLDPNPGTINIDEGKTSNPLNNCNSQYLMRTLFRRKSDDDDHKSSKSHKRSKKSRREKDSAEKDSAEKDSKDSGDSKEKSDVKQEKQE